MKIQYVITIHLMRWLTNFYDFRFKWTATAAIGIHPTKAWLSQLVNSKMQSGRADTLEEWYAIKFCYKLGKNDATETHGMFQTALGPSCMNRASVLSCIRDSRKAGMMRGVVGVRKSIHQSLLAKGLGLGLQCWGFKGVQEEIPREEASILQIGSMAFPAGQCTSSQLHPCHRLLTKMGIKTVPHSPYSRYLAPCDFWLFRKLRGCGYETIEMKEAVTKVIDTLTQVNFDGAFQKLLEQ